MDFLTYLTEYEHVDTSDVQHVVKNIKSKEDTIIAEAFNTEFPTKKQALWLVKNEFINENVAPKDVDTKYVKKHMKRIVNKINSLSEGDIRIIIHNHEGSKGGPSVGFEEESAKPKRKRGRPRKETTQQPTSAPQNTGVIYDDNETVADDDDFPSYEEWKKLRDKHVGDKQEPEEEDIVADVVNTEKEKGDEMIFDDLANDDDAEEIVDSITDIEDVDVDGDGVADLDDVDRDVVKVKKPKKEAKLKWSDLVKSIEDDEEIDEAKLKEDIIDELSEMDLSDEELSKATSLNDSEEDETEREKKARELVGTLSKLKK